MCGGRRYAAGDKLESWLHELLCLDAAEHVPRPPAAMPHPDECELYYVERDTLFSYHKARAAPPVPDPGTVPASRATMPYFVLASSTVPPFCPAPCLTRRLHPRPDSNSLPP